MNLIEQDLDQNGILTLTLNRPEKLNALSTDVLNALAELFISAKVILYFKDSPIYKLV